MSDADERAAAAAAAAARREGVAVLCGALAALADSMTVHHGELFALYRAGEVVCVVVSRESGRAGDGPAMADAVAAVPAGALRDPVRAHAALLACVPAMAGARERGRAGEPVQAMARHIAGTQRGVVTGEAWEAFERALAGAGFVAREGRAYEAGAVGASTVLAMEAGGGGGGEGVVLVVYAGDGP